MSEEKHIFERECKTRILNKDDKDIEKGGTCTVSVFSLVFPEYENNPQDNLK